MEVSTAPLLVRRRGKKRKSEEAESSGVDMRQSRSTSDDSAGSSDAQRKRKLFILPEEVSRWVDLNEMVCLCISRMWMIIIHTLVGRIGRRYAESNAKGD